MRRQIVALTFALSCVAAPLAGCPEDKGPMEKAGEKVDKSVEEGVDKTKDAVKEVGEKVEEVGDKIEDAVE